MFGYLNRAVPRCQVEPECLIDIKRLISDLHEISRSLPRKVSLDDWSQNRLYVIDLLDDKGLPESDGQLESIQKFWVLLGQGLNLVLGLYFLLEPIGGLSVWIDDN